MATKQPKLSVSQGFGPLPFWILVAILAALSSGASAEDELRTLKGADGTVILHPFRNGMPLPAEGQWSIAEIVGPAIFPKDDKLVLAWVVKVNPKTTAIPLGDTVRVVVEDATNEEARVLFEAAPVFQDGSLAVRSPEQVFSKEEHPWAFTPEDSILVFRISLIRESGDVGDRNLLFHSAEPTTHAEPESSARSAV